MTFRRFAFNNVRRNAQAYGAYFLSSSFAVMIFFTYAMLIFHPQMEEPEFRIFILEGVKLAEYIIFFFSFLFVLYSVGAFLKARQQEFGVLMIHGMSRGQLNRLVFLENMFIGLLAMGFGMLAGLLFIKLFFLIWERVLGFKGWSLYLPTQAIGLTLAAFFGLFLVISFLTVFLIRSNRVIELLQGSQKPKKEPKSSRWLSLLAVACLVTAYGMAIAVDYDWSEKPLYVIIGLTVVGTYFLFSQLSLFFVNRLKVRRRFYWRGINLLWVSDLAYRMRDNARMLFLVTIILTVAFTATGVVLAYNQELEEGLPPFAFSYFAEPGLKPEKKHLGIIEKELKKKKLDYDKMQTNFFYYIVGEERKGKYVNLKTLDVSKYDPEDSFYTGEEILIIGLAEYNRFAEAAKMEKREVKPGEALYLLSQIYPLEDDDAPKALFTDEETFFFEESGLLLEAIGKEERSPFRHDLFLAILVVSDVDLQKLNPMGSKGRYTAYQVPNWKETNFGIQLVWDFAEGWGWDQRPETQFFTSRGYASSKTLGSRLFEYAGTQMVPRTGLFIGIFIAAIFVISAGSFLYFRLYTDLNQDRVQYRALAKVGLSEKEMRKAATMQVVVLFFVPFVVAVVHTGFALNAARVIFPSMLEYALITIGAFFLFQLLLFFFIRSRYLYHLKRAMI